MSRLLLRKFNARALAQDREPNATLARRNMRKVYCSGVRRERRITRKRLPLCVQFCDRRANRLILQRDLLWRLDFWQILATYEFTPAPMQHVQLHR